MVVANRWDVNRPADVIIRMTWEEALEDYRIVTEQYRREGWRGFITIYEVVDYKQERAKSVRFGQLP